MSAAAGELVRRALGAFERADADAFARCFTADAEFLLPRNLIEGGGYNGHERIRTAVADAHTTWERIRFDVRAVDEADGDLLVRARVENTPRCDGPTVEYNAVYRLQLRDGLVAMWRPVEA